MRIFKLSVNRYASHINNHPVKRFWNINSERLNDYKEIEIRDTWSKVNRRCGIDIGLMDGNDELWDFGDGRKRRIRPVFYGSVYLRRKTTSRNDDVSRMTEMIVKGKGSDEKLRESEGYVF